MTTIFVILFASNIFLAYQYFHLKEELQRFVNQKIINKPYICPANGWINCMPILSEEGKKACSQEAVKWYKENCPDFKGVAQ